MGRVQPEVGFETGGLGSFAKVCGSKTPLSAPTGKLCFKVALLHPASGTESVIFKVAVDDDQVARDQVDAAQHKDARRPSTATRDLGGYNLRSRRA
ncbi:hypothetical protein KSP40_PGU001788 [Platanthera guangdongensis]|uniref:Uncharacterized protein n=1 Tax=Platanthera guangdongensis TaxID=2320717 RepID=A0ABR2M703_9ASPA